MGRRIVKEKETAGKRKKQDGKNGNQKEVKTIELNVGFTILKIIAIILIISLITAQTVRTIIQARTNTSETSNEEETTYTMVDSTELDEDGNYIQVPVPDGYTASEIVGETGVSTGFVIYEGDIDWDEILGEDSETTANVVEDESSGTTVAVVSTKTEKASASTTENATETQTEDESEEGAENDEEKTTYTVTVYYKDESTRKEIADSETITYTEGDEYTVEQKDIDGYTYSSIDGEATGTVTGNIEIIYYYTQDSENGSEGDSLYTVTTYYKNENGEEIATSNTRYHNIDDNYETSAKTISGYEYSKVEVEGDEDAEISEDGTITGVVEGDIEVTYYYEAGKGTKSIADGAYTVTVYYIDENTSAEIADEVITEYETGDEYTTEQLEITGYTYSSIDGDATGTIEDEDIEITYYYTEDYYKSGDGYTEEQSEAIWDLQCNTTQWVWIPVSEEDLETIYGIDENGKYWGKLYSPTSKTTAVNWKESNGVMSITSSTGYREPDITPLLTAYDTDEMLTSYLNGIARYELLKELEENYYKTIESIMKYGGFYVGRYETGDLNQTEASITKCNTNIASKTWYVMYEKCEGLARGNTNVRTSMIWDSLYDYIYRWFIDTEATKQDGTLLEESEIWSGVNGGSRSWGNYAGSEFTYYTNWDSTATKTSGQTALYQTGISYYTAINNVFDLAGDVCDRTLCVYGTQYVVWRGDNCYITSTDNYAAYRSNSYYTGVPTYSLSRLRLSCYTLS